MPADTDLAALARRMREFSYGSPEREAMLERLAAEIRSGRYEIDANKLASRLLEQLRKPDEDPPLSN